MKKYNLIYIFIAVSFLILAASKVGVFVGSGDESAHLQASFFYSDFAKWWLNKPTLSVSDMFDFASDYQTQYKALGAIRSWPQLQHWTMALITLVSGKVILFLRIPSLIEAVMTLLITYLVSLKLFPKNGIKMALLASFFVLLNPVFFQYAPATGIDMASGLFYVLTFYMLLGFLKTERKRYLYLTAACAGLAVLSKQTMFLLVPIVLISLFVEKRSLFSFKNRYTLLKALALFVLVVSPYYILIQSVFINSGFQSLENQTRFLYPSIDPDQSVVLVREHLYMKGFPPIETTLPKFTLFVSTMLYELFLLPFLVFALIKMRKSKEKGIKSAMIFIFVPLLFFTLAAQVEPRYVIPFMPIPTVFAMKGLFDIRKHVSLKHTFKPVLVILAVLMILFTCEYVSLMNARDNTTRLEPVADYVIANTDKPSTVVTFRREILGLVFNMKDTDNIYVAEPAHYLRGSNEIETNYTDEEELMIMLDSTDYVHRPSKPSWDVFRHPPVQWVVVTENSISQEKYNFETGRTIKEFMDERNDFSLVEVVNGNLPGSRVFIYKRQALP